MDLQFQFFLFDFYTCDVSNTSITEPNSKIKSISGVHHEGKDNKDVKVISFLRTVVIYFLRGLGFILENLKSLLIYNCGLKKISREDLIGLYNLEEFTIVNNKLNSLPSNLFAGKKKLKEVSFTGNKLEFVSSELLKLIYENGLTRINLRKNKKIDAIFDTDEPYAVTLEQLMEMIDKQCSKPVEDEYTNRMFKDDATIGRVVDFWKHVGFYNCRWLKGIQSPQDSSSDSHSHICCDVYERHARDWNQQIRN